MKKGIKLLAVALSLLLALSLAGCGASAMSTADSAASEEYYYGTAAEAPESSTKASYDSGSTTNGIASTDTSDASETQTTGDLNAEKIIYSASAEVETTDYENAVQAVYAMTERFGGFMESTSISGSDYYDTVRGRQSNRTAQFVIRVPSENFETMTSSLSELGNVPYCNTYSQNVTTQYYDVQSRLEAYQTQEARLLEMLAIADTVEDMLAIQEQLTEVQYQIDSLTSTLKNYDNQVNYSSVTLTVQEVEEYTPEPTVTMTYWEKMSTGFQRSLKSVGQFFTNLFLWLISSLPVLLVLAAVIAALALLIRRWLRKRGDRSARRAARRARRAERRAARKAPKTEDKKQN